MSRCQNPDHEECPTCTGCVPCGCLCHLAPETVCPDCGHHEGEGCGCPSEVRAARGEPPLTLESMGLLSFRAGDALQCLKCQAAGIEVSFHEMLVIVMGEEEFPCAEWTRKGLLPGRVGEHLCCRCSRCGYGFPMHTADA